MSVNPAMITHDVVDPVAIGGWWAEQTGGEVLAENDGWFVVVGLPNGLRLGFQRVEQPTPGKNRVHLDLEATDDVETEIARLEGAGARVVDRQQIGDFRWVVLHDPAGNVFCVSAAH
ncbi:VOC family protein [Aeromicrobium phragmitis]|uniref:VOC family protein n=1 Tax=Aeromicrobium phragmitis TaxID=2478914 RepID=A0A3L8PLX3_9ACTN|nr:VOC family protein [Aeromicrobium phragmitis]RLV55012.1 VOC family protein [Aeromicrobium phragmitis]